MIFKLSFKLSCCIVLFWCTSCSNNGTSNEANTANVTSKDTAETQNYASFDASRGVTKISPDLYKQLADTLNLKVLQGTYHPGDSSIMHAHPDFALYVLEGGLVELTAANGTKQNIDFKKDMAVVLPAETHSAKNIGNSTLRLIVMEVNRPRN